eukprot:4375804-Pyramimonas_sp.AAC.1
MSALTAMGPATARLADQKGQAPTKQSARLAVNHARALKQTRASQSAFLAGSSDARSLKVSGVSKANRKAVVTSATLADAPKATAAAVEQLNFLTPEMAQKVAKEIGTPCYVYDMPTLKRQADIALAFPNAFGLTVRYAM